MEVTKQRTVLITGAAGGLGSKLVEVFLAAGWRVAAGQHSQQVHAATDNLRPVQLDVTNASQVAAVVEELTAAWGHLDVLINNAAITADGLIANLSLEDWQRVLDVNLKGAFLCTQAVLPAMMLQQRDGHIINVSSFAAKNGHAGQVNYVAAKAGLIGLTQSMARECGKRNVRVNAIFPGVLATPLNAHLTTEQLKELSGSNTLGRSTTLEEVAAFVLHLAGMRHVSGQVFQLDSRVSAWT